MRQLEPLGSVDEGPIRRHVEAGLVGSSHTRYETAALFCYLPVLWNTWNRNPLTFVVVKQVLRTLMVKVIRLGQRWEVAMAIDYLDTALTEGRG